MLASCKYAARRNLDAALQKADDNDEHFYDAELLRIRAHTHVDPDARTAGFAAAAELARRQGAALFELRATLNDFELRGQPARAALVAAVSRSPTDGAMPEVALARAALNQATRRAVDPARGEAGAHRLARRVNLGIMPEPGAQIPARRRCVHQPA